MQQNGGMSGKPALRDGLVYLQCLFLCWALQASVNLFSVHVSLQNKSLSNNNFFQHENWQYLLKLQIVGCISGSFTSNKRKRSRTVNCRQIKAPCTCGGSHILNRRVFKKNLQVIYATLQILAASQMFIQMNTSLT